MFLRTLVVVGVVGLLPAATFADTRVQVCIGDKPQKCPYHQYFARCGSTVEVAAKDACGFSKANQRLQIGKQSTISGGKCGYTWFVVLCSEN
jgi:hypothetical protein